MKKSILALIAATMSVFLATPYMTQSGRSMYNRNGRWENSARGNPYGDSRINRQADPRFNPSANPGMNRKVDPRFNPEANPTMNRKADPRFNPSGDPGQIKPPTP